MPHGPRSVVGPLRALAIAVAALALLPAAAEATTYRGKTSQGRPASIRTGAYPPSPWGNSSGWR